MRSVQPVVTEPLPLPKLCLSGKTPRGAAVELTHIDIVPNMNLWPLFHNGVAAGLRIMPSAGDIDSTWILYNKPKVMYLNIYFLVLLFYFIIHVSFIIKLCRVFQKHYQNMLDFSWH